MVVADVMTTRVVSVEMDDRLSVVKEILDCVSFHHLLVVEGDELRGIISERDLLRCLSPFLGTDAESVRDSKTIEQRAHQIMTRSPFTITSDIAVRDALTLMLEHHIGCLPIIDDNKICGIFTLHDGLRALLDN